MMLVESPPLAPGSCYVTGRSEGPFIDTGYDIDDRPVHGRVYIATSFVSDAVGLIGGLGPHDAQRLREAVTHRDARIAELEEAINGLTRANEALVKAGYSPTAFAPVDDLAGGQALEDLDDDDLIELAVTAELELPSNSSREDIIAALTEWRVNA